MEMLYNVRLIRGLWTGIVFSNEGDLETTLTICTENSLEAATRWCEHFIATGEELPDAFDRKN